MAWQRSLPLPQKWNIFLPGNTETATYLNSILTLVVARLYFRGEQENNLEWSGGGAASEDFCAGRRGRRPNELQRDLTENRGRRRRRTHTRPVVKSWFSLPSLPRSLGPSLSASVPFQLAAFPMAIIVVIIIICQPFICPRRS